VGATMPRWSGSTPYRRLLPSPRSADERGEERSDAPDRQERDPESEAGDARRGGPPMAPAEQAHGVVQRQVADQVAPVRRLESNGPVRAADRPRQDEEPVGDVE